MSEEKTEVKQDSKININDEEDVSLPIQVILPHNILNIYKQIVLSDEPLSCDSEFLQYLECYFIFTYQQTLVKNHAANELMKDVELEKIVEKSMNLLNELTRMKKKLRETVKERVSKCVLKTDPTGKLPLAPRITRLAKDLKLSIVEELAFGFVLVSQAGSYFPFFESSNISTVSAMSLYCDMSPKELLDFLSPQRLHIENGLIEMDRQYRDSLSNYVLKMPKPAVHALVGSSLSPDEFLKIDKTALARILQKEPTFKLFKKFDEEKEKTKKSEEEEVEEMLKKVKKEVEEKTKAGKDISSTEEEDALAKEIEELEGEFEEGGKEKEKDFDLYKFMDDEKVKGGLKSPDAVDDHVHEFLAPYMNNIEYLDDRFELVATKIRIRNNELEKFDEKEFRTKSRSSEAIIRELKAKERMLFSKCQKRLEISKFEPRLEILAKKRGLCEYEKMILIGLVGAVISHEIQLASNSSYSMTFKNNITVGYVLWILSDNLEERIKNRIFFYKNSKLVSDGMISIRELIRTDLMDMTVDVDRRMLDFIVGLDTEFSEIVDGSNLFDPKVKLDQVILPIEQKKLIVETVENFEAFKKCRKKLGFEEVVSYGNSLVMLFYGASGTGKTMLANALANHLKKKLLLINFGSLGDNFGDVIRYIFRESKINDALLFFDECDAFFEKRRQARSPVVPLLSELEKYDGLIIMATNCAHELDEAIFRRITLNIEFHAPDAVLREKIWKNHFPKDIKLEENIDWVKLSIDYELTGGLIKNAVLSALSFAIARDGGENPVIREEDLMKGAKHQLRGIFTMNEFDRRVIPRHGIADIVLSEGTRKKIEEVIQFEKARKVLFSQWGFSNHFDTHQGTSILCFGPPGTGQKKAAEAIAFEVGAVIKSIDLSEIISKYVYNTTRNIEKLFQETRKTGAVLCIEVTSVGSEIMKNSMIQLLSNISNFSGIVIVITNLRAIINEEFTKGFKFVLEFEKPNSQARLNIWRKIIPPEMPISKDVNIKSLAQTYDFTGGNIENVLIRAASRVALEKGKMQIVTQKILEEACKEELSNVKFRNSGGNMYQ